MLVGLVLAPGAPPGLARAEPGTPGRPQAPDPVYLEDFANTTTTVPIPLSEYVGARPAGLTYTADPAWLDQGCNGSIVRADMAGLIVGAGCAGSSWGGVRQLAWALGKLRGADDADAFANYALSSFTQGDPGPGVVFATESDVELASDNRFLVFSVDAMASNCNQTRPELRFSIVNGGTATPLGDPLDPCAGPFSVEAPAIPGDNGIGPLLARGDTLRSTEAFLYTGSSFGLVLRNEQGSGAGNDSAIDNIAVVDATPQLDQSFTPERLVVGDVATLTYTVTNTNDLAAKTGWRLANTLPTGLAVAGTVSTTCVETEVAAEVGSRSVTVVNGRLRTGESSCAITVPVRADLSGTYVNAPADFTLAGLDAAAAASVTFTTESASLSLTKSADEPEDRNDNELTDPGDTIDYTFAVRNTGAVRVTGLTIEDGLLPAGPDCDATTSGRWRRHCLPGDLHPHGRRSPPGSRAQHGHRHRSHPRRGPGRVAAELGHRRPRSHRVAEHRQGRRGPGRRERQRVHRRRRHDLLHLLGGQHGRDSRWTRSSWRTRCWTTRPSAPRSR